VKIEHIFGLHSVQHVLQQTPQRVLELYVLRERDDQRVQQLLETAAQAGVPWQDVPRQTLDKLSEQGRHQGVVARCKALAQLDEDWLWARLEQAQDATSKPLLLVLDGVQDPHNLGACLRTADAAGVMAVIVPKDRAVGLSGTARKVASGAAETVPLLTVTNLARCLRELQDHGVWLVGMAGEAEASVYQADFRGAVALVLGAEGDGLRRLTRETCDQLVRIPMQGQVESLNVSVAAGICLFEAVRQRGLKPA